MVVCAHAPHNSLLLTPVGFSKIPSLTIKSDKKDNPTQRVLNKENSHFRFHNISRYQFAI